MIVSLAVFTVAVFFLTVFAFQQLVPVPASVVGSFREQEQKRLLQESQQIFLALAPSDRAIVSASRQALLETGMSDAFLDASVALLGVSEGENDWVVQWSIAIGEYTVPLKDRITVSVTGALVHLLPEALGRTHDIGTTLTHTAAEEALERCIGSLDRDSLVMTYRARVRGGSAQLLLEGRSQAQEGSGARNVGSIDLETGECKKGLMK